MIMKHKHYSAIMYINFDHIKLLIRYMQIVCFLLANDLISDNCYEKLCSYFNRNCLILSNSTSWNQLYEYFYIVGYRAKIDHEIKKFNYTIPPLFYTITRQKIQFLTFAKHKRYKCKHFFLDR